MLASSVSAADVSKPRLNADFIRQSTQSSGLSDTQLATALIVLVLIAAATSTPSPGPSDRRLKQNVVPVGTHTSGLPLYRYTYAYGTRTFTGVMAQEAIERFPLAVGVARDGMYRVDYSALH